jgi:hypothetical protein
MKSFPIINNNVLSTLFDEIVTLYNGDKMKLLEAAVRATATEHQPFIITPNDVDNQIPVLKNRILRTADSYGQSLLIKWIEELYDNLTVTGAVGVSNQNFIEITKIQLIDNSYIKYLSTKKWVWIWEINVEGNENQILLHIRGKENPSTVIVKDYILQYVQQAINAYNNQRPAAALSLMSIALEGTLRDALAIKGYTYSFGSPAQDVYEISDMHIHKLDDGYKVTFPNGMPNLHTDFLNEPESPTHELVRIKRIIKNERTFIEIRGVENILDFWSSNTVAQEGQTQIGGLGAAIDVSRNLANILAPTDLPPDLDRVIQSVRNNLIHLSGTAMDEEVMRNHLNERISLGDFLSNKNRVFDAVCTIGETINTIFNRIASETL